MVSPMVDAFCVGAASITFTIGFLFYAALQPNSWAGPVHVGEIVLANILINWPHFLASYRELYRHRRNLRNHPWVAVVLPVILIALVAYGVATANQNPPESSGLARQAILDILYPAAVLLLAWHYTGQSWGMTATFAHINGIRFTSVERFAIRSGYRSLLIFHLLWVLTNLDILPLLDFVYPSLANATLGLTALWIWPMGFTFIVGAVAFFTASRRHPQQSILRSWLPWLATFGWYILIRSYPSMFFVLQIAHALQYLTFPLRVEANQYAATQQASPRQTFKHTALYYLCLVAIGAVVFDGLKLSTASVDPLLQLSMLVSLAINIHHYFIDGVIWKLRRPGVRSNLFGHLEDKLPSASRQNPAKTSVTPATVAASSDED